MCLWVELEGLRGRTEDMHGKGQRWAEFRPAEFQIIYLEPH